MAFLAASLGTSSATATIIHGDVQLSGNFIEPGIRIITNFGRNVDDSFGTGRLSAWDEVQLKATDQL